MAGKKGYIQINFDFARGLSFLRDQAKSATEETMEEVFKESQSKVKVETGNLKSTGYFGVKKKNDDEWLGWCAYGQKDFVKYAVVEEMKRPYLKPAFDKAQKGFDDKIKVPK